MTDREQVISELRYMKRDVLAGSAQDQTLDKAILMLKKREPVKAKKRTILHMWYWCCGACGVAITEGDKFCRMCSREVKWDE